jgi:PST family polysaccharide transporter
LSALSITRPIGWTISSYLQARDRPRAVMALECFKVVALVGAIVTLGRHGPLWTCAAVGVAFALHALGSLWVVQLGDGISLVGMLGRLAPPLLACVPMVGAVLSVRWLVRRADVGGHGVLLMAELAAGAIAYVLAALVVARRASREFLQLLKNALRRRRGD